MCFSAGRIIGGFDSVYGAFCRFRWLIGLIGRFRNATKPILHFRAPGRRPARRHEFPDAQELWLRCQQRVALVPRPSMPRSRNAARILERGREEIFGPRSSHGQTLQNLQLGCRGIRNFPPAGSSFTQAPRRGSWRRPFVGLGYSFANWRRLTCAARHGVRHGQGYGEKGLENADRRSLISVGKARLQRPAVLQVSQHCETATWAIYRASAL